jgi:hypothetical protein
MAFHLGDRKKMNFHRDDVEKAFIQAGADDVEAVFASELFYRFVDLAEAESEKEIKNIFRFLRNNCFLAPQGLRGAGPGPRADRILAVVCFDLGIFALSDEGYDPEKCTASEIDVNKALGVDLEALLYQQTVDNVMQITRGEETKHAQACGLSINTVTWEDTGRFKGSCWGNNISDMTLAVEVKDSIKNETFYRELPIIRTSNFADKSADLDPGNFNIKVGNASNGELFNITLQDALERPWELLTDPEKWPVKDERGLNVGLYTEGIDKKVLVSAQACLLPITAKGGEAIYKPHIYNYQSFCHEDYGPQPYVLTMMVTRKGTSVSICGKNKTLSILRGESLWFNDKGERAPLASKRPNVQEQLEMELHKIEGRTAQDNADQHNRVLIVQVPLIPQHTTRKRTLGIPIAECTPFEPLYSLVGEETLCSTNDVADYERSPSIESRYLRKSAHRRSRGIQDIENAVINTGETEGEYDENLSSGWKRDTQSPIRITVQLAKATSNGVITSKGMADLAQEIQDVYQDATRLGSLVIPT